MLTFFFIVTKSSTGIAIFTAIFIATQHEKVNVAVNQIRIIISFILNFSPELKIIKSGP